jgi:ribosome-binding protein aMBF1 (putative translation factor)
MGEDPGTGRTPVSGTSDPEQLQQEIERTREQLGETVEALAEKTDVKAQAKRKLEEVKATASDKTQLVLDQAKEISPEAAVQSASQGWETARANPALTAGAFIAGFLLGRVTKR